jgi:hypothetical protein
MVQGSFATERRSSGAVAGLALFAGLMMAVVGAYQVIVGIAALIEDQFYVVTPDYAYQVDVTTWGWVHLGIGALVAVAGWAVIDGQAWGRVVGIIVAMLSAVAHFFFIPYYPVWSLLIITLDVLVIWALCAYRPQSGAHTELG